MVLSWGFGVWGGSLGLRVNVVNGNVTFTAKQIGNCMSKVSKLMTTDDIERGAAPTQSDLQVHIVVFI